MKNYLEIKLVELAKHLRVKDSNLRRIQDLRKFRNLGESSIVNIRTHLQLYGKKLRSIHHGIQ